VFDNEILAQTGWRGFAIAEVSCPTSYVPDASSITFRRSVRYSFGCLGTALTFRLANGESFASRLFAVDTEAGHGKPFRSRGSKRIGAVTVLVRFFFARSLRLPSEEQYKRRRSSGGMSLGDCPSAAGNRP